MNDLAAAAALEVRLRDAEATVADLRRQVARLRDAARSDSLTGLANRAYLNARLRQALSRSARRRAPVGLLMIDVDDFKWVNDTFGHPAGDAVLREVADRLRSCTRAEDTIARFGGDEFVVLLEDVATGARASAGASAGAGVGAGAEAGAEASVAAVARRVAEALRLRVHGVSVTASVGYAVGDGRTEAAELIREADESMYRVKRARRTA